MATMLGYFKNDRDAKRVRILARDIAAHITDEMALEETFTSSLPLFLDLLHTDILDLCCLDINEPPALEAAERVRSAFDAVHMMLIAKESLSPVTYMKPGIMASSLLLIPFTDDEARAALKQFINGYLANYASKSGDYILESKEGKIRIPYSVISFFEARDKRLYLCTKSREYAFYDTLDHLAATLPTDFLRCHKSFIINTRKVISLAQNTLELENGYSIPVSRSYKQSVKNLFQE